MYRRFVAIQGRHPILTSLATGAGVMSLGDSTVQLACGKWDGQRNAVVSVYNGGISPLFFFWWKYLDTIWPGAGVGAVVRKALTNQMAVAPFNSLFFLTWCTVVESLIQGGRAGCAPSMQSVWDKVASKATAEIPQLVLSSNCFWLPANAVNFMFMPQHFRVLFMSSCAVVWGAYVSYVVHR
mmetsp:Transcript_50987/g.95435  ORF Transcript_50987/g.95435 Transcript_50987/m.95435 type:complete len:182 (-) Transcript_50987:253-798(-)